MFRLRWRRVAVLTGDLVVALIALGVASTLVPPHNAWAPALLFFGVPIAHGALGLHTTGSRLPVGELCARWAAGVGLVGAAVWAVGGLVPALALPSGFLIWSLGWILVVGGVWRILERFDHPCILAVYRFSSRHRQLVVGALYGGASVIAYAAAYLLRFEFAVPEPYVTTLLQTVAFVAVLRLFGFRALNLSRERWRHIGPRDIVRLVAGTTLGSLLILGVTALLPLSPRVPRSVILIDWMFVVLMIAGVWLGYRTMFEILYRRARAAGNAMRRAVVVGAGEAGSRLVKEMVRDPMGFRPVAFVDDDRIKWGTRLHGLEVRGGVSDLPEIARELCAEALLIAIPSAGPAALRRIVGICEGTDLSFKVLPSTEEVLSGSVGPAQLRDVQIEDLLGRAPVQLELPELRRALEGASVLVTGAAGSIGSELTRQIAANGAGTLILLDKDESELYFLDLALRRQHPEMTIVPVVGDLLDEPLVEHLFLERRPAVVFHAAAYKHVPLMEDNARSAVRNNVLGTNVVAEAAGRHGAERFVLISTDKAVRPASVMGATKRAAELIVLDCAHRFPHTWYTGTRFGNVLGSRGSVVPLFERQLAAGLPLTVTHPEVTRYFMTIPEAVQLVLQASLLEASRGRIAMLDMGEPVRILDLARRLIRLKGLEEGVSARIEFCGLRPGEKLHEELCSPDEDTLATAVAKIRVIATPWGGDEFVGALPLTLHRLRYERGLSSRCAVQLLESLVPSFDRASDGHPPVEAVSA